MSSLKIGTDATGLKYYSVEQLLSLSEADLRAIYAEVPTYRQKAYREIYAAQVKQSGSDDDANEFELIQFLLDKYQTDHLVPVGDAWFQTPTRIREAVMSGEMLITGTSDSQQGGGVNWLVMGGSGLLLLAMLLMMILGGGGDDSVGEAEQLAPLLIDGMTLTPTPRYTQTPTPIALEGI